MADFCRACVLVVWGVEGADLGAGWHLCEGCGIHLFDERGDRSCSAHVDPHDVGLEPCDECLTVYEADGVR